MQAPAGGWRGDVPLEPFKLRDLVDQQGTGTLGKKIPWFPGLSSLSFVPRRIASPYSTWNHIE